MSEWLGVFRMGGYGAYVWPAYGVSVMLLCLNAWRMRRQERLVWRRLKAWCAHRLIA